MTHRHGGFATHPDERGGTSVDADRCLPSPSRTLFVSHTHIDIVFLPELSRHSYPNTCIHQLPSTVSRASLAGPAMGGLRFPWIKLGDETVSQTYTNALLDTIASYCARTQQFETLSTLALSSKTTHALVVPHLYGYFRLTAANAVPLLAGLRMPPFDRTGARYHDVRWANALAHWIVMERPKGIPLWVREVVMHGLSPIDHVDDDDDDDEMEGYRSGSSSDQASGRPGTRNQRSYPSQRSHSLKMAYLKQIATLHVDTVPDESLCHHFNIMIGTILNKTMYDKIFPRVKEVSLSSGAVFQLSSWQGNDTAPMHPFLRTLGTAFRPDHLCVHPLPDDTVHESLFEFLTPFFHGPGPARPWQDVLDSQPFDLICHLVRSWFPMSITIHGAGRQLVPSPPRVTMRVFLADTSSRQGTVVDTMSGDTAFRRSAEDAPRWEWIYPTSPSFDERMRRNDSLIKLGDTAGLERVKWSVQSEASECRCCGGK